MNILTFLYITTGIVLVWFSAQKLEKYSVSTAVRYGMSPFLIGSTVIAFGTSAPEILTSLFAAFENKSVMVIGNVIGSNVANIALVFGLTLGVLFFKKEDLITSCNENKETALTIARLQHREYNLDIIKIMDNKHTDGNKHQFMTLSYYSKLNTYFFFSFLYSKRETELRGFREMHFF